MKTQVILPALGMAQETGIIVRWLKAEGQEVTKGEPLVEIETDKATVEIEASASGILTNVTGVVGVEIPVGQVIASITDSAEISQENTQAKGGTAYRNTISDGHTPPQSGDRFSNVTASPLAARIAAEHNLDLETIKPAGKAYSKFRCTGAYSGSTNGRTNDQKSNTLSASISQSTQVGNRTRERYRDNPGQRT